MYNQNIEAKAPLFRLKSYRIHVPRTMKTKEKRRLKKKKIQTQRMNEIIGISRQ
jgi:hypothetical protein